MAAEHCRQDAGDSLSCPMLQSVNGSVMSHLIYMSQAQQLYLYTRCGPDYDSTQLGAMQYNIPADNKSHSLSNKQLSTLADITTLQQDIVQAVEGPCGHAAV